MSENPDTGTHEEHGFTNRIVKIFLESNLSLILILLATVVGLAALGLTPREEDPQIVVPLADVYVNFPGHSAAEVEQLVTTPLEKMLYQIDGVEYVYSMSRENQAIITVRYYVGEDRERSLVKLQKKLSENLDVVPPGVSGWVVKPVEIDDVPVVTLTLSSATSDGATLRRVAEEVTQRLAGVRDVSRAYVVGGQPRVVQVLMDPDRMAAHQVSPLELQRAIQGANVRQTAGDFRAEDKLIRVEAGRPFDSARQLRDLVVGVFDGRPVFLKDVANVEDGPEEVASYVRHGWGPAQGFTKHEFFPGTVLGDAAAGGGTSLSLKRRAWWPAESTPFASSGTCHPPSSAMQRRWRPVPKLASAQIPRLRSRLPRRRGSNAVWVANAVLRQAEELREKIVPGDMELVVTRNYGLTADEKVNELVEGLAVAILIVVALLTLGLGWREALIVAVAVPGRLRAHAGREPDAGLHDQPRHAVCADSLPGAPGGRPDRGRREHRSPLCSAQESDATDRPGGGGGDPAAVDHGHAGRHRQLSADVLHHRDDGPLHAAHGLERAGDHAHVDGRGLHDHALAGIPRVEAKV